ASRGGRAQRGPSRARPQDRGPSESSSLRSEREGRVAWLATHSVRVHHRKPGPARGWRGEASHCCKRVSFGLRSNLLSSQKNSRAYAIDSVGLSHAKPCIGGERALTSCMTSPKYRHMP